MSVNSGGKIKKLEELSAITAKLKKSKQRIVLCHGVFDLLHLGHIRYLNSAKKFGDILIVTVTADKFVKRGPGRPVFNHDLRAEALANLAMTDFVCVANYPTAIECIKHARPDFYVKGPNYASKERDITGKIFDEEKAVHDVGGEIAFTDDLTFSSSELINLYFDSHPEHTVKYLKKIAAKYTMDDIEEAMATASKLKVLVIGDTIIDQYHYCAPLGKSAKENIIANRFTGDEDFAGGTLATANHIAQVCKNVELLTVLGKKNSHEQFIRARLNKNIKNHFVFQPDCVTTAKRRYINPQDHRKLFEVVYIDDQGISGKEEQAVLTFLKKNLARYDLVVVSDFGHGMLTPAIIKVLCKSAKCLAINVQTNSANMGFNLVTKYSRADFVCIDQQELRLATGEKFGEFPALLRRVQKLLKCEQIISTRGSHGSISYSLKYGIQETPGFSYQTVDTVGAGDAFYAYVSPCFATGMKPDLLGFIGNAVGCLKTQIVGNREPVSSVDLKKFMTRLLKV